jgi:hypothetical protein
MITLTLTEREALTLRQALDVMVRQEGLPALRKVLAADDKIVAAGTAYEEAQALARAKEAKTARGES